MAGGGLKAVLAALLANAGIALAKFIGYLVTGSSSMLAESVHSLADTSNQALLLLGRKTAQRRATREHPFGFGRERYFYAFVVALLLFVLGAVFAVYEGIHKVRHGSELALPGVALAILVVAILMETYSLRTAVVESRQIKGEATWWSFIRHSKSPELTVVLLEDAGAVCGLVFAFIGVSLSVLTGNPVWDGIGTIMIGALLGIIAIFLIVEMKSLLIGEGSGERELAAITEELTADGVERVLHIRTQYLGPDELLVAAKLAMRPEMDVAEVAREINAAEARLRARIPAAQLVYLEPDLYRSP